MKKIIFTYLLFLSVGAFAQVATNGAQNCEDGEYICSDNGTTFSLSTGQGTINDLPTGSNISNPTTNPGAAGNSGCLLSGELNPNWFVINIGTSGLLEFTIGSAGSSGFYDWALWPYYTDAAGNTVACSDIISNSLAPAACNWNGSSAGFTGMYQQGSLPAGATQVNFEYAIPVVAGEQYVLCFSNYSSGSGNVPLTFGNDIPGNNNPNSAQVTCQPDTPDQTICNGTTATVNIVPPPTIQNPTYNWLVTNGVSNTTSGTNVQVTPTVTTEYHVEIFDAGGLAAIDTFTIYVENPPTPDAGPDQVLCLGDPIQLAGVASDPTANNILWYANTSQVSPTPSVNFSPNFSTQTPVVTVNQLGTYLFILREGNALCGNRFDTMQVVVSNLTVSATGVAPSCEGSSDGEIHIDAPGATEYSFDNGVTWVADSFDVVFPANTYSVCARNAQGCQGCANVIITDPAPVTVSVSNDTLICENGTASLTASATGGTSYLFHWDHTSNTNATQQVSPSAATTYTVYAENENGCVSPNETIDVTVRPGLTGNISIWDTICPGYPTNIWADVTGGIGQPYTINWSTGDVQNGPAYSSISVNPANTTTYTVTINDGCESTPLVMETRVRVAPLPVPDYYVTNPDQCEPAVFEVINTTDASMSQYVYWLVDGHEEFLNQDTIYTQEFMAGEYDLQMIVTSYEGCVDSLTFEDAFEVLPRPTANFSHSPNPVQMFNTNVYFNNTSFLGTDYQWFFESGNPATSSLENPQVQFPDGEVGTYEVILVTTSELGCTDTMEYQLVVLPEVIVYAPNSFTPDGDEHNQGWRLYIEGVDIYNFELLVFNRWGEIVWESHDPEVQWDGTFNGKPAETGTYTWTLRTKDILNDSKYTYSGHITLLR